MKTIREHPLAPVEAALWWLGQAGYIVRVSTVVIDPYSRTGGGESAEFTLVPAPIAPEELRVMWMPRTTTLTIRPGDHPRYPAKRRFGLSRRI
jgi:hypothetical protein